jgi:hypothetical protein
MELYFVFDLFVCFYLWGAEFHTMQIKYMKRKEKKRILFSEVLLSTILDFAH